MLEIDRFIPQEGWFIGLLFDEGYWLVKLLAKQQRTKYAPYEFNSGLPLSAGSVSGWETPTDTEGRYYLEPQDEDQIYQIFMGVAPSTAKIYFAYPKRVDRMNLIAPRDIPGLIGYWDGEDTPYRNPSPETEIWTTHDLVPYFDAENPSNTGTSQKITASFYVTPFSYQVIRDIELIKKFIRGEKRATLRTMGDPDQLISAPSWLLDDYRDFLIKPEEVEI